MPDCVVRSLSESLSESLTATLCFLLATEQAIFTKTHVCADLNCGGGQAFGNESQLEMNEMYPTQQPMPLLNEVMPLLHQEVLTVKHFEEVTALTAVLHIPQPALTAVPPLACRAGTDWQACIQLLLASCSTSLKHTRFC